jgi:hypothetical protein
MLAVTDDLDIALRWLIESEEGKCHLNGGLFQMLADLPCPAIQER